MQYNIIYREKNGGWQYIISYKLNGKWRQKSKQGFPLNRKGKQQAKDAAIKELDNLKSNPQISSDLEGATFGKLREIYIQHCKLYYKAFKSIESADIALRKFKELDDIEFTKIKVSDIQGVIDSFIKDKLKPNTIITYFKYLRIMFNYVKEQYGIVPNIKLKDVKLPKPEESTKRALTIKETQDVLNMFRDTPEYLFVFLAIKTGMRKGEILGLTWNDIDLQNRIIRINKQWKKDKNNVYDFGDLKGKNSYRDLPVSKKVINEILKYRKVININGGNDRVIKLEYNQYRKINRKLKKRFDISIHELRHTYATKLISNGMDFKTAALFLGHDVRQTEKTYSHVNKDMLESARKLIDILF